MEGEVTVTYQDGNEEVVKGGDLFYWQPGHPVRVGQDAEISSSALNMNTAGFSITG
jgi:hypothetical protein